MLKTKQMLKQSFGLMLSVMALLLIQSCHKESVNSHSNESGNVRVRLLGESSVYPDQGTAEKRASIGAAGLVTAPDTQQIVLPFGCGTVTAQLTRDDSAPKSVIAKRSQTSTAGAKAASIETQPLESGTQYRVLVYDQSGAQIDSKVFTHGNEDSDGLFQLDGDRDYIFVAVSTGAKNSAPTVQNAENLSSAIVSDIDANTDLMYFRKAMRVSGNVDTNYVDVILAHQFSRITTTIQMDPNSAARNATIKNIINASVGPSHSTATLNLADGTINYGSTQSGGAAVVFPEIPAEGVAAATAVNQIAAPETLGSAIFNIDALTLTTGNEIIEMTRPVRIENLNIIPGHRYNLNLTFSTPCLQVVPVAQEFGGNYPSNPTNGSIVETTHEFDPADFGFVFDLYSVDNSFNMVINGTPIATNEIQFERNVAGYPQNLLFEDNAQWGLGTVPEIWNLDGERTPENRPIVRVVIADDGNVSLFGSKVSGSSSDWTLMPLKFKPGTTFNTVNWYGDRKNTVTVSQVVQGATAISGNGRGYRRISCAD